MENLLKHKLESGQIVFGSFNWTASTMVTECFGLAGLDYAIIDAEHSPIDTEGAVNMVRAAKAQGLSPIIRAKDCTRPGIMKMLDLGAEGLIVPNLRSVDEVKTLVDFGKYPPIGRRGFAFGRRAGFGFDENARDIDEYLRQQRADPAAAYVRNRGYAGAYRGGSGYRGRGRDICRAL